MANCQMPGLGSRGALGGAGPSPAVRGASSYGVQSAKVLRRGGAFALRQCKSAPPHPAAERSASAFTYESQPKQSNARVDFTSKMLSHNTMWPSQKRHDATLLPDQERVQSCSGRCGETWHATSL